MTASPVTFPCGWHPRGPVRPPQCVALCGLAVFPRAGRALEGLPQEPPADVGSSVGPGRLESPWGLHRGVGGEEASTLPDCCARDAQHCAPGAWWPRFQSDEALSLGP